MSIRLTTRALAPERARRARKTLIVLVVLFVVTGLGVLVLQQVRQDEFRETAGARGHLLSFMYSMGTFEQVWATDYEPKYGTIDVPKLFHVFQLEEGGTGFTCKWCGGTLVPNPDINIWHNSPLHPKEILLVDRSLTSDRHATVNASSQFRWLTNTELPVWAQK